MDRIEERGEFKFIRLKSGRLLSFRDAHSQAKAAQTSLSTAVSRMLKLIPNYGPDDADMKDWDLERIEWVLDHVEEYIGYIRAEIQKQRGTMKVEERIALLRNVKGRTPEEAKAFLKKADELERR